MLQFATFAVGDFAKTLSLYRYNVLKHRNSSQYSAYSYVIAEEGTTIMRSYGLSKYHCTAMADSFYHHLDGLHNLRAIASSVVSGFMVKRVHSGSMCIFSGMIISDLATT
jgi:hypothetical protein